MEQQRTFKISKAAKSTCSSVGIIYLAINTIQDGVKPSTSFPLATSTKVGITKVTVTVRVTKL